ncbi:hypothetical protein LARI1_G003602 [Lachnellula arida]|uniref:Aminoglycoside phosphotransferase domain-containing protein n=1 Tax=Lachnellula arida TaxID=1316785 RepID=A0A8T9BAT0_9HELO|nr:hypothetical protein LARI1_G003602 [Lachnellula arida]
MPGAQSPRTTNENLQSEHIYATMPKDIDLLQSYCDADLVQYIQKAPRLPDNNMISILSATLIAKNCPLDLLQDTLGAMEAAAQLGIRVPDAKRIVTFERNTYLVMARIDGITLEEAWPKLGWLTTAKLALQLRGLVRLLRSSTSSTAGSMVSGECRSFYLEDRFKLPPRSSPAVITSFIQFWTCFTTIGRAMKTATATQDPVAPTKYIPATPRTLVFTHHDLAPRNLLLDRSGQLWVLDWDYAGWYPEYFEYAAMQNFLVPRVWTRFARARWFLFTWVTVGRFEREREVLESIRSKFTRFTFGRRFEILANRAPARHPASLT